MKLIYTRPSRDAGWSWLRDDGRTPADNRYQALVPLLQRLEERRSAYFVCTEDHKVLEIFKSHGKKVDERENFVCTVEEYSTRQDEEYGRKLILALLHNSGSFTVPEDKLLPAMTYACRRLPSRYARRLQLSEEDFPGMMTADLLKHDLPPEEKVPADITHWIMYLPQFGDNEERLVDRLCRDNSGYVPEHMLQFFAYLNGAPFRIEWQNSFIRFFSGSPDISFGLVKNFIDMIRPSITDPLEVFGMIRNYPAEAWRDMWVDISREHFSGGMKPEQNMYELYQKPIDSYPARFRMAVRNNIALGMPLDDATPEDLYRIYCDAVDMEVPTPLLLAVLGRDENSMSIIGLVSPDSANVSGIVPAVLYLYGELSMKDCIELYGDRQLAKTMTDHVTELCLPPLLQKKALKKITALISKE